MRAAHLAAVAALLAGAGAIALFFPSGRIADPPSAVRTAPPDPAPAAPASTKTPAVASVAPVSPLVPAAAMSAQLSVELAAPSRVRGGNELSLELRVRSGVAGRGWLELGFDPGVLTLADVSVHYESRDAGVVRIYFDDLAQAASASLQFATGFGASSPTVVHVVGGEFVSMRGQVIGLALPPAARIVIEQATVPATASS